MPQNVIRYCKDDATG